MHFGKSLKKFYKDYDVLFIFNDVLVTNKYLLIFNKDILFMFMNMNTGCTLLINRLIIYQNQNQKKFIWSYFRPRIPLLRPNRVAVAEATWKKIKNYSCI